MNIGWIQHNDLYETIEVSTLTKNSQVDTLKCTCFLLRLILLKHFETNAIAEGPLGCGPNSGTVSAFAADVPGPVRDIRLGEPEGTEVLLSGCQESSVGGLAGGKEFINLSQN